jgi:hypothetical protein
VAGPFNIIHAHENPECEPPTMTMFLSFSSLILAMIGLKYSRLRKLSPSTTFSLDWINAGNQVKNEGCKV